MQSRAELKEEKASISSFHINRMPCWTNGMIILENGNYAFLNKKSIRRSQLFLLGEHEFDDSIDIPEIIIIDSKSFKEITRKDINLEREQIGYIHEKNFSYNRYKNQLYISTTSYLPTQDHLIIVDATKLEKVKCSKTFPLGKLLHLPHDRHARVEGNVINIFDNDFRCIKKLNIPAKRDSNISLMVLPNGNLLGLALNWNFKFYLWSLQLDGEPILIKSAEFEVETGVHHASLLSNGKIILSNEPMNRYILDLDSSKLTSLPEDARNIIALAKDDLYLYNKNNIEELYVWNKESNKSYHLKFSEIPRLFKEVRDTNQYYINKLIFNDASHEVNVIRGNDIISFQLPSKLEYKKVVDVTEEFLPKDIAEIVQEYEFGTDLMRYCYHRNKFFQEDGSPKIELIDKSDEEKTELFMSNKNSKAF